MVKGGAGYVTDKQLQNISNIMLFKTVTYITKELRNKAVLNLKQFYMHCFVRVTLWNSYYFKQDSKIALVKYVCVYYYLLYSIITYITDYYT